MVSSSTFVAIVLSILGAQARGEVLDFGLTYCGPCQQMNPIVEKLAREGYPIRKVDGERDQALASKFNVSRFPTFILVIDGREVQRVSGLQSEDQLRMMLAKIPASAPTAAPAGRTAAAPPGNVAGSVRQVGIVNPPGPFRSSLGEPAPLPRPVSHDAPVAAPPRVAQVDEPERMWPFGKKKEAPPAVRASGHELEGAAAATTDDILFRVSTRIRVRMGDKINRGSGTIIESKPGRTLIMTCGHIFRGIDETAKIEVDVAPWEQPQKYVAQLVKHDLEADVGVIAISTNEALPVAPVARRSQNPKVGDPMVCIGCSGGQNPTREQIRVTALDKYEGPSTIECGGLPVQGRSGGGLFDAAGRLTGICINADPQGQRGIYAGLSAVQDLLTSANLSYLHSEPETRVAETEAAPAASPRDAGLAFGAESGNPFGRSAANDRADAAPAMDPRNLPESMRGSVAISPAVVPASAPAAVSAPLDIPADDAEVVVVIRKKNQPQNAPRVIVIHEASAKFQQYLEGELGPGGAPAMSTAALDPADRPLVARRPSASADSVGESKASRIGLPQTTLSEEVPARPYVRRKK